MEEETIKREFASLLVIPDNYKKYVLYRHSSFRGDYEGIPMMGVDEWLLEE